MSRYVCFDTLTQDIMRMPVQGSYCEGLIKIGEEPCTAVETNEVNSAKYHDLTAPFVLLVLSVGLLGCTLL